ncbi:YdeI/OmpD-associated family protein [Oleiharenicola lentus]|uniref:YdeI/OmpD-associated family protein n=1 Tax=Oleiharenicola lentus TaxID=2508720 RepID=UPI003F662954
MSKPAPKNKLTTQPELLTFADAGAWKKWLTKHHDRSDGAWLLIAKKGTDQKLIAISDALDVALCYGWIDSQRKGYDAHTYLQRYSRRTKKSPWSQLNVERAESLIAAQRMRAPGFAEIAAAKADGRWAAAYAPQRGVTLPPDVAAAFKIDSRARIAYAHLAKTARYAWLLPVMKATTPVARAARLKKALITLTALSSKSRRG